MTQYVVFTSAPLSCELQDGMVLFMNVSSASLNAWHLQERNKHPLKSVEIKTSTECALCIPGRSQPANSAKRARKPGGKAEPEGVEWGPHTPAVVQIEAWEIVCFQPWCHPGLPCSSLLVLPNFLILSLPPPPTHPIAQKCPFSWIYWACSLALKTPVLHVHLCVYICVSR